MNKIAYTKNKYYKDKGYSLDAITNDPFAFELDDIAKKVDNAEFVVIMLVDNNEEEGYMKYSIIVEGYEDHGLFLTQYTK